MKKTILLTTMLTFIGCVLFEHSHSHDEDGHEHEIPGIAVTQWTGKMEIFMEYDTPVVGNEVKYIIHLTTLKDFLPVTKGLVTLTFTGPDGQKTAIRKDKVLREGIYTQTMSFEKAGSYEFSISYKSENVQETFYIGSVKVYDSEHQIPVEEQEEGEEFSFLKEQQWKIDFATEEASYKKIRPSLRAVGIVKPQPSSYAEIVSPVDGIISITESVSLVKPGQKVEKGDVLAVLVPPLSASNSWSEIFIKYEQARNEYERAIRLKERQAISDREFEQARLNYDMQKAGFSTYFETNGSSISFDPENSHFHLTAPVSGVASEVTILPGQHVEKGQRLISIVNQDKVWLSLDLFSEEAAKLREITGLSLSIPGRKKKLNLGPESFEVISRGETIDPVKRTQTVWIGVDNSDRQLLIGQVFNARVYSGALNDQLVVPSSAIYDDNSQQVVMVHVSGESFEKRIVSTGPEYFNDVAILSGLSAGERVVTRGGYLVKLASTSEEIGHPHAH